MWKFWRKLFGEKSVDERHLDVERELQSTRPDLEEKEKMISNLKAVEDRQYTAKYYEQADIVSEKDRLKGS